jgi:CRISPR-associated protein Csm1
MHILITASGIQDYIFSITQKAASTRLRGRSARLGLVLDRCYQRINEEFEGKLSVVRNAGSRLEVDLDSSLDAGKIRKFLSLLQSDLDHHSIKELDSQVWFTIAAAEADDEVYRELPTGKLRPGQSALQTQLPNTSLRTWNPESFIFKRKIDERKFQREESESARDIPEAKLGRALAREVNTFFRFTSQDTQRIKILDRFVDVRNDDPGGFSFTLKPSTSRSNLIYKPVCRHAPMDKERGRLLDLGEIADQSTGAKFLGVFKADLDNAGKVFSGLQRKERQKLSQDVELFFTKDLQSLIEKHYRDCYVVYSGGDDLFLLGPWNQLIHFALDLRNRLSKAAVGWKAESLTLSAGFKLAHPSSPVRYVAMEVDKALDHAKENQGKNCISIFERLLQWDELEEGIAWAEEFTRSASDRKLSVGFLQRLQYYADESRRFFEGHELSALRMIPLLQNDWLRNRDQIETDLRQRLEARMLPLLKQLNPSGWRMWRIADFAARFACYALR